MLNSFIQWISNQEVQINPEHEKLLCNPYKNILNVLFFYQKSLLYKPKS